MEIKKTTFMTKVFHSNSIFLTPTLKLGLMKHGPFSGFSHDVLNRKLCLILFIASFTFYSCSSTPEPINYGKDECEHCRMMITDNKYGAEVVTNKGKIFKFDSIECLIEFALEKNSVGDVNQLFLVTNYAKPAELMDAGTAYYVHNDNIRSPMGLNVSAFETEQDLNSFIKTYGGKKLTWLEVIELVKQSIM